MLFISETKDGSQVINLTRGDDAVLEVPMENLVGEEYEIGEEEYLIFGVRRIPSENSELLVEIKTAPGSNRIVISHDDTVSMDPGAYSAEIQLMTAEGKRITIYPELKGRMRINENTNRKNFILMPEVVLT